MSASVSSSQYEGAPPRVTELDHLINKACYSRLWGYDFLFNTTMGFDEAERRRSPWLEFGCWSRVASLRSRLHDYDWILYANTDYVVHDMSRPLESFLRHFELHGKANVSIFVPTDDDWRYAFSTFAALVRNDNFGQRVLHHWNEFAHGVCPNGNYLKWKDGTEYDWTWSDQPGLWYAPWRTHEDLVEGRGWSSDHICNRTSGLIREQFHGGFFGGPRINEYFRDKRRRYRLGHSIWNMARMPDGQRIIWSSRDDKSRPPLGLNLGMSDVREPFEAEYAMHEKNDHRDWPKNMKLELEVCREKHGCHAGYTEGNELRIGCNGIQYYPAAGQP